MAETKNTAALEKEIARLEAFIENQRKWNREKNIRTAESKQKQIDRMLKDLDIPETELAEIYGITQQGISKRIKKIREKLKKLLEN